MGCAMGLCRVGPCSWFKKRIFFQKQSFKKNGGEAVKLHCISSHNKLFLKVFGNSIIQGFSEMVVPLAIR